jgi:hypothetical protein
LIEKRIARCGRDAQCAKISVEPRQCEGNAQSFATDENQMHTDGMDKGFAILPKSAFAVIKKASATRCAICAGIFPAKCTGMRIGEAIALRWSDIDLVSDMITLPDNRHSSRHMKAGAVRTTKGRRGAELACSLISAFVT